MYTGRTVVITGAGAGIGRALAAAYAREGANAVLLDKDGEGLKESAGLLADDGFRAVTHVLDVASPNDISLIFNEINEKLGRIDILINNAGIGKWISPYELSVEDWDTVIHTNLRGTFLCAREAARHMKSQGGGAIVNIASTRALMSEPNSEAYAATKGGIVALTHALAMSLSPDRITVNAISPGWIETKDYASLRPIDHEQHPSRRVGRPDDIARACLYLTNPENDFVTGVNLVVDGGMTKKMIYEE